MFRAITLTSASLGGLLIGAAAVTAACGDDAAPSTSPGDGGNDAGPAREPPVNDSGPVLVCADTCAQTHADGVAKDNAITACWQASCAAACGIGGTGTDTGGDPFATDAGPDADASDAAAEASLPDASSCQQPVVTPTDDCDTCTKTFCCAAWDACFGDPACTALNACVQACPTTN